MPKIKPFFFKKNKQESPAHTLKNTGLKTTQ